MCFYMLCENPEVEKRLRAEMLKVVGHDARPTLAKMREMKYTRAFLNGVLSDFLAVEPNRVVLTNLPSEVLRLYPPIPLEYR